MPLAFTVPGIESPIEADNAAQALLLEGASESDIPFEYIEFSDDGSQITAGFQEIPGIDPDSDLGSISVDLKSPHIFAGGQVTFVHGCGNHDTQHIAPGTDAPGILATLLSRSTRDHAGADGDPFLSIFLDETSFVFDGRDNIVYASHGGYGEPVTSTFVAPENLQDLPLREALDTFEHICRDHLNNQN